MSLAFTGYQTRSVRFQQELEAAPSDVIAATARQAITELPIPATLRMVELARAELRGPILPAETARQQLREAGLEGELKVPETGITQAALDVLIERKRAELKRRDVLSRSPGGFALGAAQLGTAFAASLLDPLNVGLAFVPVVGEARYLRYLASARGIVGRSAVRAGVGALEGAAGAAIVEPVVFAAMTQEQADYDFTDSLLNVAFGTVFGGGLHVIGGVGREVYENVGIYRGLARSTRDQLRSAYFAAEANKPTFDNLARQVASDVNGEAMLPGIKGRERAVEKTQLDYEGDASKLKDLVRGTIVVDSIEQAQAALAAAGRRFGALEGVRNTLQREATPTAPDGYRDIKVNVRVGGRTYELQINLPEMLEAKKKAHPLYEQARTIEGRLAKENREPTPEEKRLLYELRAKQRKIYDEAWETSLRNSSSDTSVPFRKNEEIGNLRPPGTSQARTVQSELVTGTPSTSANSVPAGNFSGSISTTSAASIAESADPRVREVALRTAVAHLTEGKAVEVEPLFRPDPASAAREAAEARTSPEADLAADVRAAEAADAQLAAQPKAADDVAIQEQLLADELAELEDVARVAGIDLKEELAEFDEAIQLADTYARAARAAAICGLGH